MNNYWLEENEDLLKELQEAIDDAAVDDANKEEPAVDNAEWEKSFIAALKAMGDGPAEPDPDEFFAIKEEDIVFANSIGWYPDVSLKAIQTLEALCKENISQDKKAEFYEAIWDVYDTLLTETVLPAADKMHEEIESLKKITLEQNAIIADLENKLLEEQRSLRFTEDLLRKAIGE